MFGVPFGKGRVSLCAFVVSTTPPSRAPAEGTAEFALRAWSADMRDLELDEILPGCCLKRDKRRGRGGMARMV